MKKIKLRLLLIAVIAIIGTLLSQTSLAYYTTTGKAVNVVTSGSIKMPIVEKGEGDTEYPKEGIYIMPGDSIAQTVTVRNDASNKVEEAMSRQLSSDLSLPQLR